MTLEIIEGFAAALAAPQRLAGGRAEFGQHFCFAGATLRARYLLLAEQRAARVRRLRRRDAVFPEFAAAILAHPVGGPGRRQHGADFWARDAGAFQRQLDFERDHVHRGTAGIGWRDRNFDTAITDRNLAQHAEIGDGQNRDLRIDDGGRGVPRALAQIMIAEHGGYHVAPGNDRCIDCSSLSRWPRCSLCRPSRPPCCIQSAFGSDSVASLTTAVMVLSHDARKSAGSITMPRSIRPRSLSSTANISPVKAQRSSIATCARRWLSSVPSPSRTIHSHECRT